MHVAARARPENAARAAGPSRATRPAGIVIAPGDVILGAGREDRDVVRAPRGAPRSGGSALRSRRRCRRRSDERRTPASSDGVFVSRAPIVAAQARVLDRELLDAGEQHPVEMILAAEVLLAVFEQPARQRQQQLPLREQDEPPGRGRAMRGERRGGSAAASRRRRRASSGSSVASRLRPSTARASTACTASKIASS